MTNFLGAEFLREQLEEVYQASQYLKKLLQMTEEERAQLPQAYAGRGYDTSYEEEVERALEAILEKAEEAWRFMDGLSSAPIVYTGPGTTEEVIEMLERLLREQHRAHTRKKKVAIS
ncbi:MAG: hypothetical protein M1299_00650 [Firmicutes bacterium]|nr:hypothetical protein [Bacillota bacterium]MCL5038335.1 hypothetical protein [Bacillota bacterium]